MTLTPIQQIIKTIETKKNILITTRANPDTDAISSALAFYLILKKMNKQASVAIDSRQFGLNLNHSFLPELESIQNSISKSKELVLEFDLDDNGIRGLTYKVKNGKLLIRIFPEKDGLLLEHPRARQESYPYDAIVVLDSPDLESLGNIYADHTEFFYHTPIINIDHSPQNEHFGEMNLIELTAVATGEILFSFAEAIGKDLLDSDISTCLLAGIVQESRSFQSNTITPRALAIASELIALGAKREIIIQNLFYNKSANVLRLWGRILSRLSINDSASLAWSEISQKDFEETQTSEKDLLSVVDDMLSYSSNTSVVALLYKNNGSMNAIIHTLNPCIDLKRAFSRFVVYGNKNFVSCSIPVKKADEAVKYISSAIEN